MFSLLFSSSFKKIPLPSEKNNHTKTSTRRFKLLKNEICIARSPSSISHKHLNAHTFIYSLSDLLKERKYGAQKKKSLLPPRVCRIMNDDYDDNTSIYIERYLTCLSLSFTDQFFTQMILDFFLSSAPFIVFYNFDDEIFAVNLSLIYFSL